MQIHAGNAHLDGRAFGQWFVGDLRAWSKSQPPADFGLRQSSSVEIKWGKHRAGEGRAAWAACSDKTTMSVLISGKFMLRFRDVSGEIREHRLQEAGDYTIWGTDAEHTWFVEEDAVIMTVRWRESPVGSSVV